MTDNDIIKQMEILAQVCKRARNKTKEDGMMTICDLAHTLAEVINAVNLVPTQATRRERIDAHVDYSLERRIEEAKNPELAQWRSENPAGIVVMV